MHTCPIPAGASASIVERRALKSRLHVLLIEDHANQEQRLEPILRAEGYSVRIATDGETALQLAEEEAPDVVLLDLDVPGLEIREVAEAFREQSQPKRPLLIALSGPDTPEDRLRLLPLGIDLHLVEPLAIEILLNLLWRFQDTVAQSPETLARPERERRFRRSPLRAWNAFFARNP